MLTARDIETREFTRSKVGGYKTEEVEAFLDEILVDFTKLTEERDNLAKRVLYLSEKLENLRDEQDGWKEALVATQKSYEEVVSAAKQKATAIISEAETKAQNIIQNSRSNLNTYESEVALLQSKKNSLSSEIEAFKTKILAAYEEHIKLLNNVEAPKKEQVVTAPVITATKAEEIPVPENIEDIFNESKAHSSDSADSSQTIVMKPIMDKAIKAEIEDESDEDDDFLIKPGKKAVRRFVEDDEIEEQTKEDKLKDLFDTDTKKKKPFSSKPAKKASKFFKTDDDDFFDDDFDDE